MEGKDRDINESGNDAWGHSNWERQCIEEAESQPDLTEQTVAEKEQALQRLWIAFQNAAMACAQLYKERQSVEEETCGRLWTPFQDTANTVAQLYKEGLDLHKCSVDMGYQCGTQRRNKDILSWAKKKRKLIRRDELLSYLAGRSPPRRLAEVRPSSTAVGTNGMGLQSGMDFDHRDTGVQCYGPLEDFPEEPHHNTSAFYTQGGVNQGLHSSPRKRTFNENSIADNEGREGRKRSSSMDIPMDSPTYKRSRFL